MLPGKLGVGLPVAIPRQAVLGRQWGCLWMGSGSLLPGFPRPHSNSHLRTVFWGGGGGWTGTGTGAGELSCLQCCFLEEQNIPPVPAPVSSMGGGGGNRG